MTPHDSISGTQWLRLDPVEGSPVREVAPGVYARVPAVAVTNHWPGPRRFTVELEVDAVGGRAICTKLTIGGENGEEVDRRALRSFPPEAIAGNAVYQLAQPGEWVTGFGQSPETVDWDTLGSAIREMGPTDKAMPAVAYLYNRGALVVGGSPTLDVERFLRLTRPTASRWIRRAKDAGLIPED